MVHRLPHTELLLAGDFSSPAEVLASGTLTIAQKRDILNIWVRDLSTRREISDARVLLESVRSALDSLDAEERRQDGKSSRSRESGSG